VRTDIQKLLCERERIGSTERSQKTRLKLNPNLEYSDDFDSGPLRVSSARRRQEYGGLRHKQLNENLNPLQRFLEASLGRHWDDVYSDIRRNIDPRRAIGLHVLQHLEHMVSHQVEIAEDGTPYHVGSRAWRTRPHPVSGLYVHPDTHILCEHRVNWDLFYDRKKAAPITRLHSDGDVYYEMETHRKAKDGCTHFPNWIKDGKKYDHIPPIGHESQYERACQHGLPVDDFREIWYVVEYEYHDPDEIYRVYRFEDGDWTKRLYGLYEPGQKHIIRYKDVPSAMEKPFVVRKHQANSKQLKGIRSVIGGAGNNRP
jgi:hypothetical protein